MPSQPIQSTPGGAVPSPETVRGVHRGGADHRALNERIRAERISLVFGNTGPALLGNILVALLAMVVLLPLVPTATALGWLFVLLAIAAVRWRLKRSYDRYASDRHPPPDVWIRRVFVVLTVNGVWWGVFGILLLSYADRFQAGFAPFIIGGMIAAAVATLGSLRSAYLGFTLPMAAILVGTLIRQGDPDALLMAGFSIAFEITMIGTVWQVSAIVSRNIELRIQNESLVGSLTLTNCELAEVNQDLAREIEDRKRAEARSEFLASHDTLTGLPNRRTQKDRFARAAARAAREGGAVAVLFLDLDSFKQVNDTLGHSAGDRLLCVVADRLRDCLRRMDSVCRHGGDEFLVLIGDAQDREKVGVVADRIIQSVRMPVDLEGERVQVGCSIGISLYPDDGDDFELLVGCADQALYRAKRRGGIGYRFFLPDLDLCDASNLRVKRVS
ncbi:GGDEF domain-containing protein [Imhoffiella purpurea]|uniref:Diguanylate cyclase n=1 Tax=Imhoffiella purpurea TaxID=1249627 RepID=W9V9J0_9GAMM|nr:GGDEF domain-containing protein [Imhoffiella purpurea]EXJ16263.1 diguanylate cyclase [Imhoffiella purpurea]